MEREVEGGTERWRAARAAEGWEKVKEREEERGGERESKADRQRPPVTVIWWSVLIEDGTVVSRCDEEV